MLRAIVILLLIAPVFLNAQQTDTSQYTRVIYDGVKLELDNDKKLYNNLLTRFVDADTTLTEKELAIVYYGAVFQKNYDPYGEHKKAKEFYKFYNEKDYKKALPIGEKILKDNPVDFKLIFKLLVCASVLKDDAKTEKFRFYYSSILNTILYSGDGQSAKTSFVVIKVDDEYTLMGQLQVQYTGQALIDFCDKFTLSDSGEDYEGTEIWFDISQPFEHLAKMFKK
jgi:hypothetical protein